LVAAFPVGPGVRTSPSDGASDGASSGASSGGEEERDAALLFNTASRFYRQKNWRDAASAFGEFLRKYPRHQDVAEARFAAGYSLNRAGDHAAAVEVLRLAVKDEDSPWSADANFYLGRSLEALAGEAKSDGDERARRWLLAAESYGRAAQLYQKLCNSSGGSPRKSPQKSVGEAAEKNASGKEDPADGSSPRESRQRHCDLRVLAVGSQGEALYQAEKYPESARALEALLTEAEALGASPYFHRGVYVLGLSRQALARGKDGSPGGDTAAGTPRFQSAREALSVAARPRYEKEPLWEEAAFLLAQLSHQDGELEKAIAEYTRIINQRGGHAPEALYQRGIALYETQRPESLMRAREELSVFLKDYPAHALAPKARFYQALSAFELKDYAGSEGMFRVAAAESPDLAGRAHLRRGQALLLKQPPDPAGAAAALEKAAEILLGEVHPPKVDPAASQRAAEALYWKGEARLAQGGDALEDAAAAFDGVQARFQKESPELAEKALYQKARALSLAQKHAECAEASDLYRKTYPAGQGKFFAESLLLAAESAFHAGPGEIPEALRREAPRLYREAAGALTDAAEARRARYMSGVASYFLGDYAEAARALDGVYREDSKRSADGPGPFPELPFYLADSLAHEPRQPVASPDDRDRWKRAVLHYQEYLETSKDASHVPNALVNLGLCQEWLEDHEGAKKTFERFLASFPGHELRGQVRFELGNARLVLGDLEGSALAYASAAEASGPENSGRGNSGRGNSGLENSGRGNSGLENSGRGEAGTLLPARALYQKAMLERRMGKPAQAAETLSTLLARFQDALKTAAGEDLSRDSEYHRALALLEANRPEEARAELSRFLEKRKGSPEETEARNQLARSLLDAGKPADALAVVSPVIAQDPSRPGRDQALYIAAWCHSALAAPKAAGPDAPDPSGAGGDSPGGSGEGTAAARHRDEMESAYRRLISEHSQSPLAIDAMLELGQHLFNRKAYAESKKWLSQAREGAEGGKPASQDPAGRVRDVLERSLFGLGFIAFEENEFAESSKLFDRVLSSSGSQLVPRALFQAGRAFMKAGNAAEAVLRFKKVADEFKEKPEIKAAGLGEESLLRLAECYHQLQKYDEAVRSADRLLAEYPQGPLRHEARFTRGFALQFSGDFEGAIQAYRAVVSGTRAPVAARSQYHIGECRVEQKKYREAAKEFNTTVANFDFDGEYKDWVRRSLLSAGIAYQTAGDAAAASSQFRELQERFPQTEEGKAAAERLRELGTKS
jgi:TolA-binding protein